VNKIVRRDIKSRYRIVAVGKEIHRHRWIALGMLDVLVGCSNQQAHQAPVGGNTKQVSVNYPPDGFPESPDAGVCCFTVCRMPRAAGAAGEFELSNRGGKSHPASWPVQ
jgi:hypothetical protein